MKTTNRILLLVMMTACLSILGSAQAQTTIRQETFELPSAQDDWYADNGVWEIGVPTYGPPTNSLGRRAYAGSNCAATVLAGNYANNVDSRLIWDPLQPLVVPPADQNPRLRFVSWMASYAGDYGRVLIRTNGGAWRTLTGQDFYGPGQAWNQTELDLSGYAGKTVQVAFLFHSDGGSVAAGWYVDEVALVAGPIVPLVPNVAESFETGWSDWSVEGGGPWELGRPTSGPGSAHQGSNCVATTLGGNYPERDDDFSVYPSRLSSPAMVVPPASSNPRLRFWHYYSFNVGPDYGEVQIRVGTNAWQALAHYEGNSSGVWTRPSFDLSAYAGQTVTFGFLFSHLNVNGGSSVNWNGSESDVGWYLDEVIVQAINVGPTITLYPTNQTVIAGNSVSFIGGASGTDPLSYQWRFNGSPILDATSTSYSVASAQTNDAGNYDLVVTNLYGSATSLPPAVLTVVFPLGIVTQPQSQTVDAGTDVTFTVGAAGTPPFTYQWWWNGSPISGATNAILVLHAVTTNQAGTYYAVVNNAGNVPTNSSNAVLTVIPVPVGISVPVGSGYGSFTKSNNTFTVIGGGEDIEGTDDRFFFVYLPWTGDGEIMANLTSLAPVDPHSEAGLMFRDGMAVGARHVLLAMDAGNQKVFRRRLAENAYSVENRSPGTNNVWLKLMRMGDTFTGHYSTNGVNWELVWWTSQPNLPATLDIGLAVTAHLNGSFATAVFDMVGPRGLTPLSGTRPHALQLGGELGGMSEFQRVGGFKMLLDGEVGAAYNIKVSPTVNAPFSSWSVLGEVTNTFGVVPFLDAQALTNGNRFYRGQKISP